MIHIIGEINVHTFREYLNEAGVAPGLSLFISGEGGDVGYTLALLDSFDVGKHTTVATGICENESAVLACAGEGKRSCTMDALFRFVPPAPEMIYDAEKGETVEKISDRNYYLHSVLVARLAQRLKVDKIEVHDLFDGQFISSTRAKQLGLVDEVISTGDAHGNSNRLSGSEEQINKPEDWDSTYHGID